MRACVVVSRPKLAKEEGREDGVEAGLWAVAAKSIFSHRNAGFRTQTVFTRWIPIVRGKGVKWVRLLAVLF